jgi:hypothetical protein
VDDRAVHGVGAVVFASALFGAAPALSDDDVSARAYGDLRARLGVVTAFDSQLGDPLPQNVVDYQNHLLIGAEVVHPDFYKVVVEGKAWYRAVSQRPPPGQPFLLVNGEHAKGQIEVDAGDAYVDLYTHYVDLRLGNQTFAWGANAVFAPSDALNPPDLRQGGIFADPADVKLPVPAVQARGTLGPLDLIVAYIPIFQPARYDVIGQNDGLVQPGLLSLMPIPNLSPFLSDSIEDYRQAALIETERPKGFPQDGDLGIRLKTKLGSVTLAATFLYAHEAVPRISIDPQLASIVTAIAEGQTPNPATVISVGQRLAEGQQLFVGDHPRYALFGADASLLLGPAEIDIDAGLKSKGTEYLQNLTAATRTTLTAVAGVSDARGGDLVLSATYAAMIVFGMNPGERLLILESPNVGDAHARAALVHGLVALAGYRFFGGSLEVEARGALEFDQDSFALGPRAVYHAGDHFSVGAGAEFWIGPALSPFGYFWRNNDVFVDSRFDF